MHAHEGWRVHSCVAQHLVIVLAKELRQVLELVLLLLPGNCCWPPLSLAHTYEIRTSTSTRNSVNNKGKENTKCETKWNKLTSGFLCLLLCYLNVLCLCLFLLQVWTKLKPRYNREFKQQGGERRWERYKTMDLLQSTMTSRGNTTSWPPFHRRL